MRESLGSINMAREFDRVKQKVVTVMNRIPEPFDQILSRKTLNLLNVLEAEVNEWLDDVNYHYPTENGDQLWLRITMIILGIGKTWTIQT